MTPTLPINRGLMIKAFREVWGTTLLLGIVLLLVETALSYVLPKFHEQLSAQWSAMPFVQNIIKAMLGADVSGGIGPETFAAMAWVHPVVLACVWAHAIVICTRVPAGEVDRGTIDVLLGLPVSRWQVYISETAVWLAAAVFILLLAFLGNAIGSTGVPTEFRLDKARIGMVLVNLLCMYVSVGSFALLVSALSDRRGRAITLVFLVVLGSFLLNYLAEFWEPLSRFAFLSVLKYYRPLQVVRDGHWPWRDLAILLTTAIGFWTAGGVIFSRRDLTTV